MFLHRWLNSGVKTDRLFVCNFDGSELQLLSDDGMVSHCCWENNSSIVGYLRHAEQGDGYYRIALSDGGRTALQPAGIHQLGDGHPTTHSGRMITDTYPNKARMKELFLLNMQGHKLQRLGAFHESFSYYEATRCDLHPRWATDGKSIFVDSVHEGPRKLYQLRLED